MGFVKFNSSRSSEPASEVVKSRPSAAAMLVVAVVFFGLGLAVGRGNIEVNGLSAPGSTIRSRQLDYTSVDQLYSVLKNNFDGGLKEADLLNGLKEGLVDAAGDPYTEYFTPKEAKQLNDQLAGSFIGIGAELGKDKDDNIIVVSPLAGFPAEKAGLKTRDIIAAIDGETTNGISISTAVQKIRGEAGTKVKLTIVRGGGNPFEVEISRSKITIPSVEYEINGLTGYLKINQFTDDTVAKSRAAAEAFNDRQVKSVILDLRGNPGGYLSGAIDIASMWLDPGDVVVQERRGQTIIDTHLAGGTSPLRGLKTVVLINGGSASASEIVAGALKDNDAATVVGTTSFGKGSVQKVQSLIGGGELKVTIARWYTPGGKNIDKQGIKPDLAVEITDADQAAGRDPQRAKAVELVSH